MSERRHSIPGRDFSKLGIPAARAGDIIELTRTVEALRLAVNVLARAAGKTEDSAATIGDLIDLGLIDTNDIGKVSNKGST